MNSVDPQKFVNDYRSSEYVASVFQFAGGRLVDIANEHFGNKISEVSLSDNQGSVSMIFEVQNGDEVIIARTTSDGQLFWGDIAGMQIARRAGCRAPEVYHYSRVSEGVFVALVEKIRYPILRQAVSDRPENTGWIIDLAENISRLHSVKVEGYGALEFEGFLPTSSRNGQLTHLIDKRLNPETLELFIREDIFTPEEITKILGRANGLRFDGLNSYVHNDFYLGNTFLDPKTDETVLFDFNTAVNDPLFDLARLSTSLIPQGLEEEWELFVEVYGKINNLDEKSYRQRLFDIQCIGVMKKLTNAFRRGNIEGGTRLRDYMRRGLR